MNCQRIVYHHDAGTHVMAGYKERCKRTAKVQRAITSGLFVSVCTGHAKEIDERSSSNFYTTPDDWFVT